ncbi:hypothetical protein KIN20_038268 [Parelaphostrongylus tenuis]|uniref:F-box domain-containing protein n=1 Tax=Parelaphostrongylus tenuis TaxID=148309 RepID=A0AAD5REN0_PARTN|nr:hypothetical protein KIN20_038268 [Parelaphostrongylus tenuis]
MAKDEKGFRMLNDLPSHIRLRVYQLVDPKDLKTLRAVQRRDYEFVNSHRSCFRKTPVLLRVRAEEHGFIIDVYKAQFSLDKPRRFEIISSELDELYRFKELAVKSLILECAPDGDMPLLFHAACLLPVDAECSLTFKSLCFTDSDITQVLIMLTRIRSIPLLKLKECVFPANSVARFFLSSQVTSRSFRIEDDQCFIKGNVQISNDVGDELLSTFLLSDCDAISLSTVEEVSFRGLINFIRAWRRSPRQFSLATFVRSDRFDSDSQFDILPNTIYPICKSDLVLRTQLHGRHQVRLITERLTSHC